MTSDDGLDRLLTAWLDDETAPRAPDGLETRFQHGVATTRQRPGWATSERWITMETRARFGAVPRTAILLATLALLSALAAGAILAGSGSESGAGSSFGPVVFSSEGDLWTAEVDGSDRIRIMTSDRIEVGPVVSPTRTQLAFWSADSEAGPWDLMLLDAGEEVPVIVTEGLLEVSPVDWSPDGSAVVFAAFEADLAPDGCYAGRTADPCGFGIWIASSDGSSLERIGDPLMGARGPAWDPTGTMMAFGGVPATSVPGGSGELGLHVMAADGSTIRRVGELTGDAGAFGRIDWSPDGDTIATVAGPRGNNIFTVDVASGTSTQLTDFFLEDTEPIWSPNGESIVFLRFDGSADGKVVMLDMPDGAERVLDVPVGFPAPVFTDDADHLVVGASRTDEILVIEPATVDVTRIEAPDLWRW